MNMTAQCLQLYTAVHSSVPTVILAPKPQMRGYYYSTLVYSTISIAPYTRVQTQKVN